MGLNNEKPAAGADRGGSSRVFSRGAEHLEDNRTGARAQRLKPDDLSPERVEALARQRFGDLNARLSTRRELRFGRRGSVSVSLATGVFFNHETGAGGRLGAASARGDRSAADDAGRYAAERDDQARKRSVATALFHSARPIGGTLAEIYLRHGRAILAPLDGGGVRFQPHAPVRPYATGGATGPAMVARVVNAAGEMIGAHMTYLRADGLAKADVLTPRKMVGSVGGGHVPLIAGSTLVVGEGVESALSAWEAATAVPGVDVTGLGCVAALSAGGVAAMRWPASTTGLLIAPDQDASGAGEAAAQTLASRAWAAGLDVRFIRPPAGFCDWNDAARALGARKTPRVRAVAS